MRTNIEDYPNCECPDPALPLHRIPITWREYVEVTQKYAIVGYSMVAKDCAACRIGSIVLFVVGGAVLHYGVVEEGEDYAVLERII